MSGPRALNPRWELGLVAVLCLSACKEHRPPPPNEPPPSVSPPTADDPDEARLLGAPRASSSAYASPSASASAPTEAILGLRAGDRLGKVKVAALLPLVDGRLPVVVAGEGGEGVLEIALAGDGPPPPAKTQRFAIYWRRDPTRKLPEPALEEAAQALATTLRATEAGLTPPKGMRAFGKEAARKNETNL